MPNDRELAKICRDDPDFAVRIEQTLAALESGKYGPPPGFDDDFPSLPEISLPGIRKANPKKRRSKRKKNKQNRKR